MTPLLAQRPRSDRAFERLYKRHVGDVYRYALAVMRNPADAEDVTQTTFLNAYRAYVEKGSRPEKPQNWLIAIAHNVCRQRFRQSARRPSEVAFEDDIADTLVDDDTPSAVDIRRALGHLAFNQRAALVMRELEGRSYAEIAEILDVSTSAVETLIFRARRALREQLEGSLTCGEAEFAISRQLDGRLPRAAKGALRAHLRECADCATFARRQRAQRAALRSLAAIPVPSSLMSLFGGGGATVGTGLAVKAAVAVTAGVAIGGGGYAGVHELAEHHSRTTHPKAPSHQTPSVARGHPAKHVELVRSHRAVHARSTVAHKKHLGAVTKKAHRHPVQHRKANARAHAPRKTGASTAHTQHARAHVTNVRRSHRPAAPPGRTKPHAVIRPTHVRHHVPLPHKGGGGDNAHAHGE